jgi:hypothetical protein
MKRVAVLALVLECFGRCASADQITTGDLVFASTEFIPGAILVKPTSGSFVYDNTPNQFISINVSWDGMPWTFPSAFPVPSTADQATIFQYKWRVRCGMDRLMRSSRPLLFGFRL